MIITTDNNVSGHTIGSYLGIVRGIIVRSLYREIGADTMTEMRYDATEFATGITEVLAYGTAVKLVR